MEKRHEKYFELMRRFPENFENSKGCVIPIVKKLDQIIEFEKETGQQIGVLFEDNFFIMVRDLVAPQKGNLFGYDRLMEKNVKSAAVILPITENNEIVLMKVFRHASRTYSYEVPRGFGRIDMDSTENAKEELSEELNCDVKELTFMGKVHCNTGMTGSAVAVYLAKVSNIEGSQYGYEGITKYYLLSMEKMSELIQKGSITDGFTLSAWAKYLSRM